MILRALHARGILDISSQETHPGGDSIVDTIQFRLSLKPGQTVEVNDEYRSLKNIDSAINAGLLEVVSYNSDVDSGVAQEELNESVVDKHSELDDDEPEKHRLINDSIESTVTLWSSDKTAEEIDKLLSAFTPTTQTTDYSAQIGDHVLCDNATAMTITLPQSSSSTSGKLIIVKNVNYGIVAIDAYGNETIDNDKTIYLSDIWESVVLINSGTGWYIAVRDISDEDWSSESSST